MNYNRNNNQQDLNQQNRRFIRPQRNRVRRNRPRPFNQLIADSDSVHIPRYLHPNSPTPMSVTRKMTFIEPSLVIQAPLASFVVREWRINDIFDPDPTVGGGTVAGYTHYSTAFNRYRVFKHETFFSVASNEPGISVAFGLIYRDARPSSLITSYATALDALEIGPSTGVNVVGQTGGSSVFRSRKLKVHPGAIIGDPLEYMSDVGFGGTTGSSPPQSVWMAFVVVSPSPLTNLTNGVLLSINQYFTVKWYSSQKILELIPSSKPCKYCQNAHLEDSNLRKVNCPCECHGVHSEGRSNMVKGTDERESSTSKARNLF